MFSPSIYINKANYCIKNKKILIVSHQFLPHVSPRTTRWSLLIDYLVNQGNDITVLTGTKPQASNNNYDVLYFGNKNISNVVDSARQKSNDSTEDKKSPTAHLDTVVNLVDDVIESSKIGARKPERVFYEEACRLIDVDPIECVFLDDLGINLKPAREIGMTTIILKSSNG